MASIQARHSRTCDLVVARARVGDDGKEHVNLWTSFEDSARDAGCTCKPGPMYHVVTRIDGRLHREKAGRNRKGAERALAKLRVAEDEGTFEPLRNITFEAWADQWLAGLKRKPSTIESYGHTIGYAKQALQGVVVRRITVANVKEFLRVCSESRRGKKRDKAMSDSTQAKHLRVLGICLESAVRSGYAASNPVRKLPAGEKPRGRRKEAAYFTDAELPRLFAEFQERAGVYRVAALLALKTGMRLGELSALRWGDLDLTAGVIHVRQSFTNGEITTPKNHEKREVFITPDVVKLLGEWWGEQNGPGEGALVLPSDTRTGYLNPQVVLRRELYPAMERAGIERVGPTGEKRTFHSFRHTYARLAIENGREVFWLSKHLGHSSLDVTTNIYGHFAREKRQAEALAMEGIFTV
jgi:integrase